MYLLERPVAGWLPFIRRPHARSQNISWKGCCTCARLRCPFASLSPRARNGIPAQSQWALRSRTCDTCALSGPVRLSRSVLLHEGVLTGGHVHDGQSTRGAARGFGTRYLEFHQPVQSTFVLGATAVPAALAPKPNARTFSGLLYSFPSSSGTSRIASDAQEGGIFSRRDPWWEGRLRPSDSSECRKLAGGLCEAQTQMRAAYHAARPRASRRAGKSVWLPRCRPQGNCVPAWQASVGPPWCRDPDMRTEGYRPRIELP